MRILLIHPPKTHQVWAGVPSVFNDKYAYLFPPLAVMGLSAYLKQHTAHQVEVLDCVVEQLAFEQIGPRVLAARPDVVGVAATASHAVYNVRLVIDMVRQVLPDAFIVIGGPHVSAFPELAARLDGVDAAIEGDGEQPLAALLDTLDSGGDLHQVPAILFKEPDGTIYRQGERRMIHDLDSLPFSDRDAFPPGRYFTPGMKGGRTTTMMSSRGCPNRCVFCNVPQAYRARSPEHVVQEVELCVRRHGIQDIHFVDDIFNISPERVMAISELILRREIKVSWGYKASIRNTTPQMLRLAKRAGCYKVHYGVETFTNEGLKTLNKRATVDEIKRIFRMTQDEGLKAIAYMIVGCPHERTAEQIMAVAPWMHDLAPDYVVYSLFTPYPDSSIFPEGVKRGLFAADCWERFLLAPTEQYDLPTAWEEFLSKEQLLEIFKVLHRKFYYHPRTMARIFSRLTTPSELKHVLFGAFQLLRMELLKAGQRKI